MEPAETQLDQDVDMVEGEFASAEDAKEVAALNTLRDILDAKTLKQIENAIQKKVKQAPANKQVALVELVQHQRALLKQKEDRQAKKDALEAQLEEITNELQGIGEELKKTEAAKRKIDGPTAEEEAQQRANMEQQMFQKFDATMQAMRAAMGTDDLTQGAKDHEKQYLEWKINNNKKGRRTYHHYKTGT